MGLVSLRPENLKYLDEGKIDIAYQEAIKRATLDCEDRPGDQTARVVTLKAKLIPITNGRDLEGVSVEYEIESKVPVRRSRVFPMKAHKNGQLSFVEENPDNPAQSTLLDKEPDRP